MARLPFAVFLRRLPSRIEIYGELRQVLGSEDEPCTQLRGLLQRLRHFYAGGEEPSIPAPTGHVSGPWQI